MGNTSELVRMREKRCNITVFYHTFTQETTVRHELSRWLTARRYCTKQCTDRFFTLEALHCDRVARSKCVNIMSDILKCLST